MERTDEALSVLRAVENRFGRHPRVYREMGFVHLNERYDRNAAIAYFTQSLLLDKNQPDIRNIVGKDPTPDDLRKYYPQGAEIPEAFLDPNRDTLNPNLPRPPVPTVDLPAAPSTPTGPSSGPPSTPSDSTIPSPGVASVQSAVTNGPTVSQP